MTNDPGSSPAAVELPVGVVLAGGRSRRMGRDKALLPIAGMTWVEHAARRLAAVCPEVLIADRGRALVPGFPSVTDGPGGGPAAGILGAAARRPGRALLALACDLPNVPIAMLRWLAVQDEGDWLVPRHDGPGGRLEPLCARYRPPALAALAAQVESGSFALHALRGAPGLAIRFLEAPSLADFGDPRHLLRNLNNPRDLDQADPV